MFIGCLFRHIEIIEKHSKDKQHRKPENQKKMDMFQDHRKPSESSRTSFHETLVIPIQNRCNALA